jgi:hypothetical protein
MGHRTMKLLRIALFALLVASPAQAQWQTPQHSIPIGQGAGVTGFQAAVPSTAGIPLVSNGASVDPSFAPAQNAGIAPGAANTMKGSLNGSATSDITIASCTLAYQLTQWISGTGWQCGVDPVLPSRAVAATLNLSAFSAVRTLGYALPGDGGEATFAKTAIAFVDSGALANHTNPSAAGTGYTNGTYRGIPLSNGTCNVQATIVVAGTVVTSVAVTNPGNSCAVGNVLTGSVSGTGSGFSWTVTAVTTGLGSFTDSASNGWQIVMPAKGIDARAFGVKFDYFTSDALATDNYASVQNVWFFAQRNPNAVTDTGVGPGGKVLWANGTAMVCGGGATPLQVPQGVLVEGQGRYASILKLCDAWSSTGHQIEFCDVTTQATCYGAALARMQIFNIFTSGQGSVDSTATTLFTNNDQDTVMLDDVVVYPGACRRGIWATIGYGGASSLLFKGTTEIKGGMKAANCNGNGNPSVFIDYGSANVLFDNLIGGGLSAGSGGIRDSGILVGSGYVTIKAFHYEQVVSPLIENISSTNAGAIRVFNATGGAGCVSLFTANSAGANTLVVSPPVALNGCTSTANWNSSIYAGPPTTDTIFTPTVHSW